jgi:hypothetical protein
MVLVLIPSLKVALIAVLIATEVAPLPGVVDVTVGVGAGGLLFPPLDPPEQPLHPNTAKDNATATQNRFMPIPLDPPKQPFDPRTHGPKSIVLC